MKNRTLPLIIANVVLGLFIFFNIEKEENPKIEFEKNLVRALNSLCTLSFHIPRKDQSIHLERQETDWVISNPIKWTVEPLVLSNFLTKLSHLDSHFLLSVDQLDSRGEVLSDYGFDENSSFFVLEGTSNSLRFSIGNDTRDENYVFLLTEQNKKGETLLIWKASKEILQLMETPYLEWAKQSFINFPLYSIDEITIKQRKDSQKISLIRNQEDWSFTLPFTAKANTEKVNLLLNKLVSQKISGLYSKNLDVNFSTPLYELRIKGLGKTQEISLFEQNNSGIIEVFAHTNTQSHSFLVSDELTELLTEWPQKLRESKLFTFNPSKVSRIKVVHDEESLSLRKNIGESWIGLENDGSNSISFDAENQAVQDLLEKLNLIEITNFMFFDPTPKELSENGFEKPEYRLEIEHEDTTRQNVLISKSHQDSSYWKTYVIDQSLVCLVNENWGNLLKTKALGFRKRTLLPSAFLPDCITLAALDHDLGALVTKTPSDGETFERLLDFRVERFIESSFEHEGAWIGGDWVPWKYSLKFERTETETPSSIEFFLSDRLGASTWYAGSKELGIISTLPIHLIDEISDLLKTSSDISP